MKAAEQKANESSRNRLKTKLRRNNPEDPDLAIRKFRIHFGIFGGSGIINPEVPDTCRELGKNCNPEVNSKINSTDLPTGSVD